MQSRDNRIFLALVACLVIGCVFRLIGIGKEAIWIDEAITLRQAEQPLGVTLAFLSNDSHFPLYVLIANPWVHLFGTGEAAIRCLSLVFSVAAIYITYLIGTRMFSRKVGIIAATLLSFSPVAVYYAQEARLYSLFLLLTLLSFYCFFQCLHKPTMAKTVAYTVATALMMYTHVFAFTLIALESAYFLCSHRKSAKHVLLWAGALVALFILFLPWLGILIKQISYHWLISWIPAPSLTLLGATLILVFGTALCFIVSMIAAIIAMARSRVTENKANVVLLLVFLCAPMLIVFILSVTYTPLFYPKYFFFLSGFASVISAYFISSFVERKTIQLAAVGIVILGSLFSIYYQYNITEKQDWRGVDAFLKANAKPGEHIFIHPYFYADPFAYYFDPYCFGQYYLNACLFDRDAVLSTNYLASNCSDSTALTATAETNTLIHFVNGTVWLVNADNSGYALNSCLFDYLKARKPLSGTKHFAGGIHLYSFS